MTNKDITIIDKIVSGELSDQERSRELRRIETEAPECWPALAKAFVEKQLLHEMFTEIESNSDSSATKAKSSKPLLLGLASAAVLAIGMILGSMFHNEQSNDTLTPIVTTETKATDTTTKQPTSEPVTAYVATYLENGDQLVIPISYHPIAK